MQLIDYFKALLHFMNASIFQQMAKVLGAIVHFSPAQIKQVLENEEKIEATTVSLAIPIPFFIYLRFLVISEKSTSNSDFEM